MDQRTTPPALAGLLEKFGGWIAVRRRFTPDQAPEWCVERAHWTARYAIRLSGNDERSDQEARERAVTVRDALRRIYGD